MAWYRVAESPTLDGLKAKVPTKYQYIPVGKRTRIVLNTSPIPIAPIFDAAGAEFAAKLLEKGGKLIDVQGNGSYEADFEIEAVGGMGQDADMGQSAEMGLPAVILWIGVIAGILILLPLITRLATLFANFMPSGDGDGEGGVIDYLKVLFGDYYWIVLIGGAVVVYLLLKGGGGTRIYNLPSGKRRSEE